MSTLTVDPGDSIPSLAKENGHFWKTVWDHPQNLGLKSKRKDPNILFPGDEVFIPDIVLKQEPRATDQRHKFKVKGEAVKFKVRLLKLGEPRASEPYVLDVDGKLINGNTDADGQVEQVVPADAKAGRLILSSGAEVYPLRFGHLNPIDEVSGQQQRLNNLGFDCGSEDGESDDAFAAAVAAFQARYGLPSSGQMDASTKAKLEQLHP